MRLLDKPLRAFALYALLVLLCSVPAYYVVVDQIWLDELDEQNEIVKANLVKGLREHSGDMASLEPLLSLWSDLQPWIKIAPLEGVPMGKDSVYELMRGNFLDEEDEEDRFRGLLSDVEVDGRYYRMRIETNVEEADETMVSIGMVTVLFFIVLVTGFVLMNRRLSIRLWLPFERTLESLSEFELSGTVEPVFEVTGIKEFEELHAVLGKLIHDARSSYGQQKVFLENASHELQTPIAILKTKVELLLQSPDLTEEQSSLLQSVEAPLSRLGRINKNLLLLSMIGNNQYAQTEDIAVGNMLLECTGMLSDHLAEKDLRLEMWEPGKVVVNCNRMLLETLVYNLLTNAVRHTANGGVVRVRLEDGELSLSNSGTGSLEFEHLFGRFATLGSESSGSGLGLAIVKEVCMRYGWRLGYAFEEGAHYFRVGF